MTKRKHVLKEMDLDNFDHPTENQQIVRILNSRGNNLHEVETACEDSEERFLVSMPTKFRKNVWVKRGDFVIVQAIDEGDKVKAEIVRILTPQHIKEFTTDGIWPLKFTTTRKVEESNDSDSDDDLVKNTNRNQQYVEESDSDDSEASNEETESNESQNEKSQK